MGLNIVEVAKEFGKRFKELWDSLSDIQGNCPKCGCADSQQTFIKGTYECCKCQTVYEVSAE